MPSSSELRRLLDKAGDVFDSPIPSDEVETGFEADDLPDETIQTRRACRALTLAHALQGTEYGDALLHQRFFSVAIELAFQAVERTCQAVLIAADVYTDGQTVSDHKRTIRDSWKAAVWDEPEAQRLAALYQAHRNRVYYSDGIPSRSRADAMLDLAAYVHRLAVDSGRLAAEQCICRGSAGVMGS